MLIYLQLIIANPAESSSETTISQLLTFANFFAIIFATKLSRSSNASLHGDAGWCGPLEGLMLAVGQTTTFIQVRKLDIPPLAPQPFEKGGKGFTSLRHSQNIPVFKFAPANLVLVVVGRG